MPCVLAAPAQVTVQLAGLNGVVGMVGVGEGELPLRPEMRLDGVHPGRVRQGEAQLHLVAQPSAGCARSVGGQIVQDHVTEPVRPAYWARAATPRSKVFAAAVDGCSAACGFGGRTPTACETAGVLTLTCDRHVENGDGPSFASVLDLMSRATRDAEGVRWPNVEHRTTPSTLEPQSGWALGNAGIVREVLRFVRVITGAEPSYVISWPDRHAVGVAGPDELPQAGRSGGSGRLGLPAEVPHSPSLRSAPRCRVSGPGYDDRCRPSRRLESAPPADGSRRDVAPRRRLPCGCPHGRPRWR